MIEKRRYVLVCLSTLVFSVPILPQAPSAPAPPVVNASKGSAVTNDTARVSTGAPGSTAADTNVPAKESAPGSSAAPTSKTKPHDNSFIIGNEDLIAVRVWKEPEVSQTVPVRSDGRISLPLVGELQASGRTPLQLEEDISRKLATYISEPDVTVIVEQINSQKFNILGQVARPGTYSLTRATTVLDAIALAGGFRDFAKQKNIYVLRRNTAGGQSRISFNYKQVIKGINPEQNIGLIPGDTVVIP